MNEEKRICPLLSVSANHAEDGMQHCRGTMCAWFCTGRSMCSLEALAANTERAADALGDDIPTNLAYISDNIADSK